MARKDKTDAQIFKRLLSLDYESSWGAYTDNKQINKVLSKASKRGTEEVGFPDHLYVNEKEKLFILIEDKPVIGEHRKDGEFNPEKYAVDGTIWYLKKFVNIADEMLSRYFEDWKIVGLAISGNIEDDLNHIVSTFVIIDGAIEEKSLITDIRDEKDYINLFYSNDDEVVITKVSLASREINDLLRSLDSQKRPVLLSALMICLFTIKGGSNSFIREFLGNDASEIANKISGRVRDVLLSENIPLEKIDVLTSELSFLKHSADLINKDLDILKKILMNLKTNIIPLFERKTNYDIIGRFYEEFLRYAGVANVKNGIVLTPHHIATLFTDLVDIKYNDVFIDPACGTGSFLIAAMNKLVNAIGASGIPNKSEKIKEIKHKQLIGFEKNSTMYTLAISNMLFRGDGKSQIFNVDCFSKDADESLKELEDKGIKPTIGFVNPPYGGKDNEKNPTKKEIQFLIRLLNLCSRYVILIAPISTYFKDNNLRENILRQHTLKYVINMPNDLFMPNAATNTAIAVFETQKPQSDQEVVFCDLADDGFVLSKNKGRTDVYNKWEIIKDNLLNKISNPDKYEDRITLVKAKVKGDDEWIIQAHSVTDYSLLNENSFVSTIKDFLVYQAKRDMNLLDQNINEIDLLNVLDNYYNKVDGDET